MLEIDSIIQGNCLEVMKGIEDDSVDLVVTDPPYDLNSMGKSWDKALPPKHSASVMKEGVPIVE